MRQIIVLVTTLLLYGNSFAQTIGTRVSFQGVDRVTYTGVITEILGDKYKVKYDGYNFEAWLTNPQFKILTQNVPPPADNKRQSSTTFQVGDKAEVRDHDGSWLPAVVLEADAVKGYKIHYVDWSSNWDTWVKNDRIRAVGSKKETPPATNDYKKPPKDPEMNGAVPNIPGTAWSILSIYNKGSVPKYQHTYRPYLFLKNGRYEIQHPDIFTMGKYTVKGNQVTQVSDGSDKLTETYTLKWHAAGKYLELVGQKIVFRLQYNTTTTQ